MKKLFVYKSTHGIRKIRISGRRRVRKNSMKLNANSQIFNLVSWFIMRGGNIYRLFISKKSCNCVE